MKKQLTKGQRVGVRGEFGTIAVVTRSQIHVRFDDGTYDWIPVGEVHAIEATS